MNIPGTKKISVISKEAKSICGKGFVNWITKFKNK